MPGATGRLPSDRSRIEEKHGQRSREYKLRNGNVQMNDSTKPSDTPFRPVTRYRSFKMFVAASSMRLEVRVRLSSPADAGHRWGAS
jgi:hypothetical protein